MDDAAHAAILFAIAVGFVSSGFLESIWQLLTGRTPAISMLAESDFWVPLRTVGLVFCAPWLLLNTSMWWFIVYPPLGVPFLAAALGWSFLQGVFILNQVFGFT